MVWRIPNFRKHPTFWTTPKSLVALVLMYSALDIRKNCRRKLQMYRFVTWIKDIKSQVFLRGLSRIETIISMENKCAETKSSTAKLIELMFLKNPWSPAPASSPHPISIISTCKLHNLYIIWLVVGPPLWKIWFRQLGWLDIPNISGKIKFMATKPPTSHGISLNCFFQDANPASSATSSIIRNSLCVASYP